MYWYTWEGPPVPGDGSFATHPSHAIFHQIFTLITVVDVILQLYNFFLMLRVSTARLKEYRYFMALCTVSDLHELKRGQYW